MRPSLLPLATLALALLTAPAALAQQPIEDFYVTDSSVNATALSDDGQTLYIGGNFRYVGPKTGSGAQLSSADGSVIGDLDVNGSVRVSVPDGSGGYYIGGDFTQVGGVERNGIAHVLADGTLDAAWDPNASSFVSALAVSGSTVYAGGNFTIIGGQSRNRIAALDAATGAATAWNPNASGVVNALAVSGGTVYAGGTFSSIGGQSRSRIAALDATTGTVTAFNANVSSSVNALAVSGSTVYAGGTFTIIGGQTRNHIAALDATTGAVTAWNPNASGVVNALAVSGSTVYAGGAFTTIGGQSRSRIAALDATTGTATAWAPNADFTVHALAVSGSTVYAGGSFTSIGGQTRLRIAALDATTGTATAFNSNTNSTVLALAVSGGAVYAGGIFTSIGGHARSRIAALDATTGTVTAWNPNANSSVNALAVSGETVYAGGYFQFIGGQLRFRIAALDATSGAATAWDPSADNNVVVLAVSGSTVYAGGEFTSIGGQARRGIAALDAATGNATAFNANADNNVVALAVSGSTVYAGGGFTTIGWQTRRGIAALDAATGNATAWNPNANNGVSVLAVSGSTVYAGGSFTTIGGQTRLRIAALDATTGTATAWNPNSNGVVNALAVSGSTVYAGGGFTAIGGQTRNRLAALDAATGAATAWDPGANNSVVALAVSGATVYAGGGFTSIGGQLRLGLAAFSLPVPPAPFQITGTEGWRTLALPYADLPLGGRGPGYLTHLWTAGYLGADRDQRNARGGANVLLYDEPTGTWMPPATETSVVPGQGFWVNVYADGDFFPGTTIQSGFPKTLDVTGGTPVTGDVSLPVTYTASAPTGPLPGGGGDYPGPGVNLVGNPYDEAIDWDDASWTKTNVSSTVYVWDPAYNSGDYRTWNGSTGDLTDGVIPAGQGFHVVTTAADPVLTVTEAAKTGSPEFVYGKSAPAPLGLAFRLSGTIGEHERESAAWVSLDDRAALGLDDSDGLRLAGAPGGDALRLYTVVPSGHPGEGSALAIGSVPSDLGGPVEIPLHAEALAGGSAASASAHLSWDAANLPEGWRASLRDLATGAVYDLISSGSVRLALAAESALTVTEADQVPAWQKSADASVPVLPSAARPLKAEPARARFSVVLTPGGESAKGAGVALEVGEVGPNPAATRAVLPVTVASAGAVTVRVFDTLGRAVATVQEGTLASGRHEVSLPVLDLAAGTYMVRVETGSETVVRRLTVVR